MRPLCYIHTVNYSLLNNLRSREVDRVLWSKMDIQICPISWNTSKFTQKHLVVIVLHIYTYKSVMKKETCITIFISALFTSAFTFVKTQKQSKYPLADECMKKM